VREREREWWSERRGRRTVMVGRAPPSRSAARVGRGERERESGVRGEGERERERGRGVNLKPSGRTFILSPAIGLRLGLLGLDNINRGGCYKRPASENWGIFGGGLFYNNRLARRFFVTASVNKK
jgi:hypothetical protein